MAVQPQIPSSDDDVYRLVSDDDTSAGISGVPAGRLVSATDVSTALSIAGFAVQTVVAEPVAVGLVGQNINATEAGVGFSVSIEKSVAEPTPAPPAGDLGVEHRATPAGTSAAANAASAVPASSNVAVPRTPKLRRRMRARVRLRYLMQAWGVSLMVHAAILSALAAATFSSQDAIKKIMNFDSALASHRNGEPEVLPIYADPENIPRDRAIGDEHAETLGEPAALAASEGESGDDGGGIIVAGAGTGRPSATPRVRGAGKGRINEGNSLPGVKIDGLAGSPLSLLPAAAATDLSGGGKIAGDPIFDVKEIGVALDQLAREILRHLKDHKLTVVWLFDESASMQDDQKTIIQKFDRVTSELKLNIEPNKKTAGALNHAIVGFGQSIDYVLEKPREDIDQIGRAIRNLKIDSTGTENTMRAIREVVNHYSGIIRKDRRLLIVLVTDESGDDGPDVEEALQALKKYKVPLYVIGRQSLFGYPYAHHRYIDPVTKDVYHPLIRRGPETADVELYQWDGLYDRWDEQPSGFAPYELARLTKDSGGIYFVLPSEEFMRVRRREQAYSITQLKEYLPEYDNRLTYVEKCNSSILRQTLHAILTEAKAFLYRRDYPIDSTELVKEAFPEIEKTTLKLNTLLQIQRRLEELRKLRDREPEKRWQAHYDLMLAQTVAFQVKAYEYRALMASIVKSPPVLKRQPAPDLVVTWVVDHSKTPLAPRNETAKKYAEAERLLKDVILRHPKTPWADLAQDTLDRGFSVQLNDWHHNPKYYERGQFVPKY
jgi:von Willebrand factor type A domain